MSMQKLGSLAVIAFVCFTPLACKRAALGGEHSKGSLRHDGQEWMVWNGRERVHFVAAYIDGYEMGVSRACDTADHLFDLKTNRKYDHANDEIVSASGVCAIGTSHYSSFKPNVSGDPDVSAYTEVITAFYTKHAEYQNIPYEYLMQYLTDEQHKSSEELSNMARAGEIRTHW